MAELIDIFNANLEPAGTMERKQAHAEGRWHRTFHLWLTNRHMGGSILFQLRAPHVTNYPSMLDITAAGHLSAGESVEQGLREVREELGVNLDPTQIHSLGYRVEVADQANGQLNREYQAVYLAETSLSPADFRPDPNEVYGLIAISIADCFALFTRKIERVKGTGVSFRADGDLWKEEARTVGIDDFIPRIQPYYLTVAIMAERLLEGRQPLAIS